MCKRKEKESFEKYKERRKNERLDTLLAIKGEVIWESHLYGTYITKKHGKIGSKVD